MKTVITFGELMLRLAPNGYYRFFQNDQMQATFGGGEANVAVSLANYGLDSVFVTKLPAHAIGQGAVNSLRAFGVDTTKIVRGGDRVGIYFHTLANGIYTRCNKAVSSAFVCFNHTNTASTDLISILHIAKSRDINTDGFCCLKNCRTLGDTYGNAVNLKIYHFVHLSHSLLISLKLL